MDNSLRIIALLASVLILAVQTSPAQQSLPSPSAQVPAQGLELHNPIERELKFGETHAYKIALQAGQFLRATVDQRGIDVVVRVFAPDGAKVAEVDSPNGDTGPEPVALEVKTTGTYRIEVAPLEQAAKPGRYEIKIDEILSPRQYAAYLDEKRVKKEAVIKWLTSNALPIRTVEAGNGFEDLKPLKRVLKNVRFVGLGEETHGTREFFQFKHRMLEFLVKEMGFRVFAIEASYAGCRNINDYVMGKTNDGAKALDSQGFWTWNTEEVRAMMDWMRTYNASVPPDRKIKFIGFDMQENGEARDHVLSYLRRVAPDRVVDFEAIPSPEHPNADESERKSSLETFVDTAFNGSEQEKPSALKKFIEIRAKYNELLGFMELNATRFTLLTTAAEFADALQSVRVIAQFIDVYSRTRDSSPARDLYMAENLKRFVDAEPPETRFVVWAHNGHINASESQSRINGFGNHLRRFYGNEYYAVGFSFDRGGFQAREQVPKDPKKRMLTAYLAGPAFEGSIDWYLAQTKIKTFLVDLRSTAKTAAVSEWLTAPQPMRSIGAIYSSEREQNFFSPTVLSQSYDGLFFIDTTTRARPTASVKNVAKRQ